MIYQTQEPDINFEHVGCAFDSMAYAREKFQSKPWTVEELSAAWTGAKAEGILDDDYNITDWQKLIDYLGLPLQFRGHATVNLVLDPDEFAICAWHNDRTGFTHFVVGQTKPVEWDPIEGGSVTVREGYPMPLDPDTGAGGLRLFKVLI